MNSRIRACVLLLPLVACTPGTPYSPPSTELPDTWKQAEKQHVSVSDAVPVTGWWQQFDDPLLSQLIVQSLYSNRDLRVAEARLREARANRTVTASALLPEVTAGVDASRGVQGIIGGNKPFSLYEATFDASWEIDFFGATRQRTQAADALANAALAEMESVRISLAAEVARNYIEARHARNQIAIVERNLASQQDTLELTRSRRDAGLVSDLDVAQAQSQRLVTEARLPVFKAAYVTALNRLNTLAGEMPGTIDPLFEEERPVPTPTAELMISTPASVIAARPDIHTAERRLAAATALHNAAIADLYPKISLSGLFGVQNTSVLPSTTIWSVGSGAVVPLIQFGKLRGRIDAADATQAARMAEYEQAVIMALEEVETTLSRFLHEEARLVMLQKAAESSMNTVNLANERYRQGITAFSDVLTAERTLYEAESTVADSQAETAKRAVALYKALGGSTAIPAGASAPAPLP